MERAAVFKDDVLKAYDFRCAVSGLVGGGVGGLVEAAHIRGAAKPHNGPDKVTNGIALTPSIHRAFDRNLFGFEYVGDELRVVTSSALRSAMVENSASGANLTIRSGQRALLPTDPVLRPERKYVDYQRSLVIG
jgi:putative restriction endonuclease